VTCATDAGGFGGTLKLVRQDRNLIGIWSGVLGPNQQASGVWRDGYVELTFGGTWHNQPGTVIATFAGWVDGDSAKGRVKVRRSSRWAVEQRFGGNELRNLAAAICSISALRLPADGTQRLSAGSISA